MWAGIWALLLRTLKQDARQATQHLFRLAFVGMTIILLLQSQAVSVMTGAAGLQFFRTMVWLNLTFIHFAAVSFFASPITEEKEEETLGLLKMAGIGSLGLLLGKSTSRLVAVMWLLLVQAPFLLLAITLGGVGQSQIVASYACLGAAVALWSGVGLLCSVVCPTSRAAGRMMVLVLIAYYFTPGIGQMLLEFPELALLQKLGLDQFLSSWNDSMSLVRLSVLTATTGYVGDAWCWQVGSNLVGGLLAFLAAWKLFEPLTRDLARAVVSRGLVLRSSQTRWFPSATSGRAWLHQPLGWKDFHFSSGGWPLFWLKSIGYAGFGVYMVFPWEGNQSPFFGPAFTWMILFQFSWMLAVAEAAHQASNVFHEELKGQTWATLCTLPHSLSWLAVMKIGGRARAMVPVLTLCVVSVMGFFFMEPINNLPEVDVIANIIASLSVVVGVIWLFLNLVVAISLHVKWGVIPMAMMVMGVIWMLAIILVEIFSSMRIFNSDDFWIYGTLSAIFLLIAGLALSNYSVKRLTQLAQQ